MILVAPERIAEYTRAGWWGTLTLWDLFRRKVAEHPEREAVVDAPNRGEFAHGQPQRWTWAQLAREVDRLGLVLAEHGIGRDAIVVTMLPNGVEQFALYLACLRVGAVLTPVPVQYREHELDHVLQLTRAGVAFSFTRIGRPGHAHAAAAMFADLRAHHPSLSHLFAWGDGTVEGVLPLPQAPAGEASPQQLERLARAEREAAITANDVVTICWTSGTEAAPKGVPRSHNEWLIVPPIIIEAGQISAGARLLNPFPLVNMSGFSAAFATWLVLGATVVQHHPFTLPVFLQQLREERIDYTVSPPAVLNMLLQDERLLEGIDFKRLSRIGSGSAPLADWMVRGFAERYGVQIINYFGSNEGAALAGSDIDIADPALRAAFFPRAGVDGYQWRISISRKIRTRLVDLDSGEDIREPGRPGELRFRGPTVFSGYYHAPEMTQRAFDDQGYYCTGDLFEIAGDRQQFYRYVGRSKDLVIRGGMNISSEEVENLLTACPLVREAAVVGVPDPVMGEKLCACVVPAEGPAPTLQALCDYLRHQQQVAVFKLPEYLMLIDALPRNPVGKILKSDLRLQARALARGEMCA
ncbi:MAG: acyl--CoA ligase [Betaproteobacteria bacterium]|nr:acyl--CoA ligase [Betaproteobacteria bacterium]